MSAQVINRSEFERLYAQYHPRFVVIAQRYVRDAMVAEDLVTDSFVSFWENRERLDGDTNHAAYLLTIVKNKCLNWLHAQQLHLRVEKQLQGQQYRMVAANILSLEACNPTGLFAEEVKRIVERTLENMPDLTRQVFESNRFSDKTYAEIAEELGISQRRVTSEMQRALSLLRKDLRDYLPFAFILLYISAMRV
ncbi:hypothetical protein B5G09_08755 [Alistipes sp. An54]|uniref:RNA polymerase sigma-70 factor n=1 Tax=Alistipes sp. An54 TaxID=1965645 RepID=UPI000B36CD9F|nr:RNA polymerase sigma-70 factor [Alistipes sp. An54]OUN76818.1 hypothetical protein B5G09_08755 [Alistipes sp. An54]